MDQKELRELIREELESSRQPNAVMVQDAVRIAVQETLVTLGMDASDPLKLQQDMHFLREMRDAHEKVKSKSLVAVVGLLIGGAFAAIWVGIKASLGSH